MVLTDFPVVKTLPDPKSILSNKANLLKDEDFPVFEIADPPESKEASKAQEAIKDETIDEPCFEIKKTKLKGQGMFATRTILPGDLILREKPLVVMPDKVFQNDDMDEVEEWLEKRLNRLSAEDREKFFNLSDSKAELAGEDPTILGIFFTNDMNFIDDSAALFPTMARANHSCVPKADFITRPDLGVQDLVAVDKIEAGEEITISYLPASAEGSDVKNVRQSYTLEWYGFKCQCGACLAQV